MAKMKKFAVNYSGFVIVEAKNESEAHSKAGAMLADGPVVNDGRNGEWYIDEIEEEEEDED